MPRALPRLTSRQHAIVRAFRALAKRGADDHRVLLDGAHLVSEALDARVPIETILISSEFVRRASAEDRAVVDRAARAGGAIYETTPAVLDAASPVKTSTGIVAAALWTPSAATTAFAPAPALALGLVDVQDPGNVGSAIRSADALGASGVIAIDRTADPGGWKALRGSMGSTFRLPVARVSHSDAIQAARRAGSQIVATIADASTSFTDIDLTAPTLLLVGNEGAGLQPELLDAADVRVTIPMRPKVNSLNVSVTAAILLYEARRQRRAPQSEP